MNAPSQTQTHPTFSTMPAYDGNNLEKLACHMRGALIALAHEKRVPHLGSELSCIDILIAAYWNSMNIDPTMPNDPGRDRFILSKGHAAKALYTALAYRGYFATDILSTFTDVGSNLPEHPGPNCIAGVEFASGSLGHGLPVAVGRALAARLSLSKNKTFVLMSDGECNEGSVWEAAMMAAAQRLNHLFAIIDFNRWQATGRSQEVLALDPLADKWQAFGWHVSEVDGHDIDAISETLKRKPNSEGKPSILIAHTIKGKGVSFMEDDNNWHYRIPSETEVASAFTELGL
jgi:transketolase